MAALSGATLIHDVGFTEAADSASLELIAATDELLVKDRLENHEPVPLPDEVTAELDKMERLWTTSRE